MRLPLTSGLVAGTPNALPSMTALTPEQADTIRFLQAKGWKVSDREAQVFMTSEAPIRATILKGLETLRPSDKADAGGGRPMSALATPSRKGGAL